MLHFHLKNLHHDHKSLFAFFFLGYYEANNVTDSTTIPVFFVILHGDDKKRKDVTYDKDAQNTLC